MESKQPKLKDSYTVSDLVFYKNLIEEKKEDEENKDSEHLIFLKLRLCEVPVDIPDETPSNENEVKSLIPSDVKKALLLQFLDVASNWTVWSSNILTAFMHMIGKNLFSTLATCTTFRSCSR